MRAQNIDHMFGSLTFTKSADEIKAKATIKIDKIKAKIEERLKRISDLRAEHGIDDAALVQLLQAARKQQGAMQFSYSTSNVQTGGNAKMEERTIGAGAVNFLMTEHDHVEAERDSVKTLENIVRNLKPIARYSSDTGARIPDAEFVLSTDEIEYLGF